jgi:anthranilate phosphoribosyltransferase
LDGDIRRWTLDPAEHGIPPTDPSALAGGDAEENARAIVDVLEGAAGPQRDIVILNAAAGLLACGAAPDVDSGLAGGAAAIDSGAARRALSGLVEASQAF